MNFLTIFPDFEDCHIYKDVGQVNILTSRLLDVKPHVLSYNKKLSESIGNIGPNFIRIKEIFTRVPHVKLDFNIVLFLVLNSKKYKYLNLYHPTFATQIYAILYKIINVQGKVYIKLDLDLVHEKNNFEKLSVGLKGWIKESVFNLYKDIIDVVSVESEEAYELLVSRGVYAIDKLLKVPNGVSSYSLDEKYGKVEFKDKKNIFLTVARIGTKDKCNELMLDALEQCDLKNWEFHFVGPIEAGFENKIKQFYTENPLLLDKVKFLGSKNRDEVIEIYKSAKVFALSSVKEGFPLVFAESSFYGCHIITTEVSGSLDITNHGVLGDITPIGDHLLFAKAIQRIIESDISNDHFSDIRNFAISNFTWENILPKLTKKLTDD